MINDLTKTVFGGKLHRSYKLADVLKSLDQMGLLNNGELTEIAISQGSGVERCKKLTENIDLVTNKQIKHAKTYKRPSGQWIATISRNTTAPMLVVIDEQKTGKQYYLNIPPSAHRHLSGNTISVGFGSDGIPGSSQWWAYEVKDFATLCKLAK